MLAGEIARLTHHVASPVDIAELVSQLYPNPKQGTRLKRAFLSGQLIGMGANSPAEALKALAEANNAAAFNALQPEILAATARVWAIDGPRGVERLIESVQHRPDADLRELILRGIASAVPGEHVLRLERQLPGILYHAVSANPWLAAVPDIWQSDPSAARQILAALRTVAADRRPSAAMVVGGSTRGNAFYVAPELVDLYGADAAVVGFLETWAQPDETGTRKPSDIGAWGQVLRDHRAALIDAMSTVKQPSIFSLACSASVLGPQEITVDNDSWQRLADNLGIVPEPFSQERASAFLLFVSLRSIERSGAELAAKVFRMVHDAASEERLSNDSWALLAPSLPEVQQSIAWDRCERLRRALYQSFRRNGWPVDLFVQALGSDRVFRSATAFIASVGDTGTLEAILRLPNISTENRHAIEHGLRRTKRRSLMDQISDLF